MKNIIAGKARDPGAMDSAHMPHVRGDDWFVERDGVTFAGTHLLLEFWDALLLTDVEHIRSALTRAAEAAGARLLEAKLHAFEPSGGVTGVLLLAESHISIHTWPERGYAALDIFMCGDCDPHLAVPHLIDAFRPQRTELSEIKRGVVRP